MVGPPEAHTYTEGTAVAFRSLNVPSRYFSPGIPEASRLHAMIKGLVGYELLKVLYNGLRVEDKEAVLWVVIISDGERGCLIGSKGAN